MESSALGEALRASGVWTYGLLNLAHILGIATLFGSIVVLELRLMGWQRKVSLASVAAVTVPIAVSGFGVAALFGLGMLAVNGSDYIGNPFLPIKFAAIALALANSVAISRLSSWRDRSARE